MLLLQSVVIELIPSILGGPTAVFRIKLCAEVEQHAREHPEELFETLRLLREGTKALDQHSQVTADAACIMDLQRFRQDDPNELLRDRYLCRGGGLLLAGPTGIGKSSLSMQAMFSWALGKPFFGIEPVRGLRSLLIQAENDEGDLAEIRDGILRGMDASDDEREFLKSMVLTYNETKRTGAAFCQDVMRPLLERHRPALVWIDPVLAYLGGDTNAQADVGAFLRNGIAPLLQEFHCAAVLVHHTNKPPSGREKPDWQAGDLAYLGSGSAEWANWPRAVLALRSKGSPTEFELAAGKRGGRLKWVDSNGQRTRQRAIQHAADGSISWELAPEGDPATLKKGRPSKTDEEDILELLPGGGLKVKEWMELAKEELGISESGFYSFKKVLKEQERIHHSKVSDKWQPWTPRNTVTPKTPTTTPKMIPGPHSKNSPPPLGGELFVSGAAGAGSTPIIQAGGMNGFY